MTRIWTVIPATAATSALLLLGWGCALVPPNQPPRDPFAAGPPGMAPQRSARPAYPLGPVPRAPHRHGRHQHRMPQPWADPPSQRGAPSQQSDRIPVDPAPELRLPESDVPESQSPVLESQENDAIPIPRTSPEGPALNPSDEPQVDTPTGPPRTFADDPIELLVEAPDVRPVGSGATLKLTVKNVSDQTVRQVNVLCEFDDALTFPGSDQKSVTNKIPKIEAGDSKESQLTLVSDVPGSHRCRFLVTVGSKTVVEQSVTVEFVSRKLDWKLHGPTERSVGSRAEFNIPVTNVSQETLRNLTIRVDLDAALTIREMTKGGRLGERSVTWTIDRLPAGDGVQLQLEVECREPTSQACLTATVSGSDVAADDAEAFLVVKPVTGSLDVRVRDVADPVAVGKDSELAVTIMNQGLQPAKDVVVKCRWPEGFEFASAELHSGGKVIPVKATVRRQTATFAPIARLEADQQLEYRIVVSAQRAGAHQLTVSVTNGENETPVDVIEPITVHH